jgi:hypothetical protein
LDAEWLRKASSRTNNSGLFYLGTITIDASEICENKIRKKEYYIPGQGVHTDKHTFLHQLTSTHSCTNSQTKYISIMKVDRPTTMSPRTPRRSPKGGKGESQIKIVSAMSPSFTPKGWEKKQTYLVYQKPKDDNQRIAKIDNRRQGVWSKGYVAAQNPQELWVFELGELPPDLHPPRDTGDTNGDNQKHIHGVWGFKPGGDPDNPNDVWFFPPKFNPDYTGSDAKSLPKYFTERGVWTYPLIKRDASEIAPTATGWLGVGETVKMEKLDVAGTWKMLYKQGANQDDAIRGPGLKSRQAKSVPSSPPLSSPQKKKVSARMKIFVETPDGKRRISLNVLPTDTVDYVTTQIELQEGIAKSEQRLISPQGVLLDKLGETLESHSIQNGDTFRLEGMRIRIKNNAIGNERVDDIFIIDNLTPKTSIGDLKERIEQQECIDADDQLLTLQGNLLDDLKNLDFYDIKHEEMLELVPMSIQVRDFSSNVETIYTLRNGQVCPSSTIREIKMMLNDYHNLPPPDYQRLTHAGNALDKESRTLRNCGIVHKDILDLEPMQVTVKTPEEKRIILKVCPTDSISCLKQLVEETLGVPVVDQQLSFGGKTLEDPKTFIDHGIRHGDTVLLRGMQIHIQHLNGTTITLDVRPATTLLDVKEMVVEADGTPIQEQIYSFGSKSLQDDNRTLGSYNIKHGSTLKMEKMRVFIQTQNEKFPLTVNANTSIKEVKEMVEKKTAIPVRNQLIRHHGTEVGKSDNTTIAECAIQHHDTLQLDNLGTERDATYMVQISEYRDAFTYVPSPRKSKSPRAGRKVARNKASLAGGTPSGNFLETNQVAQKEAGRWTHNSSHF